MQTTCAEPGSRHGTAFFGPRFARWEAFQSAVNTKTSGEAYWAAGVDYVLRHVLGLSLKLF